MILITLLLFVGALGEAVNSRYITAAVMGTLAILFGVGGFLLLRRLLPAEVNRDPREQLAEMYRQRRLR